MQKAMFSGISRISSAQPIMIFCMAMVQIIYLLAALAQMSWMAAAAQIPLTIQPQQKRFRFPLMAEREQAAMQKGIS